MEIKVEPYGNGVVWNEGKILNPNPQEGEGYLDDYKGKDEDKKRVGYLGIMELSLNKKDPYAGVSVKIVDDEFEEDYWYELSYII
jgi:hypothetical protein